MMAAIGFLVSFSNAMFPALVPGLAREFHVGPERPSVPVERNLKFAATCRLTEEMYPFLARHRWMALEMVSAQALISP